MKKSVSLHMTVVIACFAFLVAVTLTTLLFCVFVIPKREGNLFNHNQKILEINKLVDQYYIGEVNENYVSDGLGAGYVLGLQDKYADYIPAEEAEESMNALYGYNTGIGVQVTAHPDNKTIYILEVHKDSPADKAGVESGDEIVMLDGQSVAEMGYSESLAYIKSKPAGEKIEAVIERDGKLITMSIDLVQFVSQTVFYEIIDNKGYIQITQFTDSTVDQFVEAVDYMEEQKVDGIIFDLRGNPGGTLNSVYHMVDYLIPEGLAIRVDYKGEANDQTYLSDANDVDLPMVVLTDANTASASELFAQSLKDYQKAKTVGSTTYGKGVVQRTFTLSDGSMVKFTVAKYYTANETCLDGIGVTPDIPTEWSEDELKYRLVNGIEVDKDFIAACDYLDSLN